MDYDKILDVIELARDFTEENNSDNAKVVKYNSLSFFESLYSFVKELKG